ncbi:nuclear transport factor 2 family protein [Pseudidiomarina homiensis]|uniref:nuclear transport factor 2 family protein n=1 Tax=Pseudidiomarina homiensis TaxID=364198 RepID=UPI00215A9274|nr:nuclear transport factor 2 family protein [Pseudidiomarina homiensis]
MRHLTVYLCTALFFLASVSAQEVDHAATVEAYTEAFNAQDSAAMARMVTDNVQWLTVNGDSVAVETAGRSELVKAMDSYFASCASCRSRLVDVQVLGSRVSVIEQASWLVGDERRAQSSIAVYEFSGSRIARVYYFSTN